MTEHRAAAHSDYENYQPKDELRHALSREQHGLCCYCMGRIGAVAQSMKIEHWQSQTRYPHEQLSYGNLLGACLGGQGQPASKQYCDTRKGDLDIRWNPAEPQHQIESRIRYDPDGTIRSDDPDFDQELNDVLNLNLPWLKNNRKSVLSAVLDWWRQKRPMPPERIEREIQQRSGADGNGNLQAYCQVAVYWLRMKLAR